MQGRTTAERRNARGQKRARELSTKTKYSTSGTGCLAQHKQGRHRGDSQTVHLLAPPGLLNMHVEHVQESPAGFGGGFIPAAAQLNPVTAGFGLSALGASQTVHFSVALAGFFSAHVEHVHSSAAGFGGGFMPAAAQLNAGTGEAGFGLPGRGASQTVHFSVALAGLLSEQSGHVHVSPAGFAGGFSPAAVQLKPAAAAAGLALAGAEKS